MTGVDGLVLYGWGYRITVYGDEHPTAERGPLAFQLRHQQQHVGRQDAVLLLKVCRAGQGRAYGIGQGSSQNPGQCCGV